MMEVQLLPVPHMESNKALWPWSSNFSSTRSPGEPPKTQTAEPYLQRCGPGPENLHFIEVQGDAATAGLDVTLRILPYTIGPLGWVGAVSLRTLLLCGLSVFWRHSQPLF